MPARAFCLLNSSSSHIRTHSYLLRLNAREGILFIEHEVHDLVTGKRRYVLMPARAFCLLNATFAEDRMYSVKCLNAREGILFIEPEYQVRSHE